MCLTQNRPEFDSPSDRSAYSVRNFQKLRELLDGSKYPIRNLHKVFKLLDGSIYLL